MRLIPILASLLMFGCGDDGPSPDGPPPIDSAPLEAGMVCGATAMFETCAIDDDCMSCVCRPVGHVMICTKTCSGPADCPAPSTGCTGGICQPP